MVESRAGRLKLGGVYTAPGALVKMLILIQQVWGGPETLHFSPAPK